MVTATAIEIETTTTLRDALAEKLVQHAAKRGCAPVDLMADIVSHGLEALDTEQRAEDRTSIKDQEIRALRNELAALRKKKPSFVFDTVVRLKLTAEADARGMSVNDLVQRIIEHVANDNLFTAVLDD